MTFLLPGLLSKSDWIRCCALIRLNLMQCWRGRMARLWLGIVFASQGAALLLGSMALTESRELVVAMAAFLYRLALIGSLGLAMMVGLMQERDSGFMNVLLAHPISRGQYVLARMASYGVMACVGVCSVALVMAFWLPMDALPSLAIWSVSLWLELMVTGAMALFLALGLRNKVAAITLWALFYVLARSLDVLRVMAAAPIGQDPQGWSVLAAQGLFQLLGWVIPPLGAFTRSEWLLGYAPPAGQAYGLLAAWALVYAGVCAAAAAIDFYRDEI